MEVRGGGEGGRRTAELRGGALLLLLEARRAAAKGGRVPESAEALGGTARAQAAAPELRLRLPGRRLREAVELWGLGQIGLCGGGAGLLPLLGLLLRGGRGACCPLAPARRRLLPGMLVGGGAGAEVGGRAGGRPWRACTAEVGVGGLRLQ